MLSKNGYPSATYAEGFAGPGVYSKGEDGSPVIAIRALLETPELESARKPVRFLFIDDDDRCVSILQERLRERFPKRPRSPELMPVTIRRGTCATLMEDELSALGAWGQPILAVLDSWGNAPVPHQLIKRLATNPAGEIIVTLLPQHFIRFVDQVGNAADEIFGGDQSWRGIKELTDGESKRRHLLTCYRKMLFDAGFKFLLDFEMIDVRGESIYLVFGTSHRRGLEKMKESVWQVDPAFGVQFRDPRDEMNETLFLVDEPQDAPLQRLLRQELESTGETRVEALREFALFRTVYREQHVITALTRMREKGIITPAIGVIRRSTVVSLAT